MRRIIIALGAGLLIIIVAVAVYNYLSAGTIIVNSQDSSNITLATEDGKTTLTKGHGTLTARLHKGNYVVSVQRSRAAANQIVKVASHRTSRYDINIADAKQFEPVIDIGASSMAIGSDLQYIDSTDNTLHRLDANDNLAEIDGNYRFRTIQWDAGLSGIGQDDSGRLYAVGTNGIKRLGLPTPYANYYGVAPNGKVFMSYGKSVYAGGVNSDFKKIYESKEAFTSLAAFNNGVAVIAGFTGETPKTSQPFVVIVSGSKQTAIERMGLSGSAVWSPDGKYLAASNGSHYELFDQSLRMVAAIPNDYVSNIVWQDKSHLVFTANGNVWVYDASSQRSDMLAMGSAIGTITEATVSGDGAYVYMAVTNLDNSASIVRVGLQGQKAANIVYQLRDILPMSFGNYSLSLVNFSGPPAILVQAVPPFSPDAALQPAMQQVQSLGFDTSGLRFIAKPAD